MYEAHDRARDKAIRKDVDATYTSDTLELWALATIFKMENAEEISKRPRREMSLVDDLNSDAERKELWPFDIEAFEAQLEAQMVRGDDGCFCRREENGDLRPSNPTIRWVNAEIAKWAISALDSKYQRMPPAIFCKMSGDETMPEGTWAWQLDRLYYLVLAEREGAWNPRDYMIVLWNGSDDPFPVAVFDSFPNAKEATAALCLFSNAASHNNLAVLAWRHQIDRMRMDPWLIRRMLEEAAKAQVPTAEGNLAVLKEHIPEVFQEQDTP